MIYDVLNSLGIKYKEINHEAVYTVEEAKKIENLIEGIGCKNLFLKSKNKYYLVILEENKRANIKELKKIIGSSCLTFASTLELEAKLKLTQGSVTPFGIINDLNKEVILLIDSDLKNNKLLFHPNINTKTISITFDDLIRFIEYQGNEYILID